MFFIALIRKFNKSTLQESKLTKAELPYTIAMILLDIAAPICLLIGLRSTTAANAALLNNFEIVATAIIALIIFKEKISSRLGLGILFVTFSCTILSFEDLSSLQFSFGSLFITALWSILAVLFVGLVAYGLSIYFYVYAQRLLGAARTSAYYAIAPFIAVALSLIIFKEVPGVSYFIALSLMMIGAWLCSQD